MRLSAFQIGNCELREAIFPLISDVIVLEEISVVEHHTGTMRNHFRPIHLARCVHRRLHETEVASSVVHANIEEIAVVVGVVLHILLARFDDLPVGLRLIGGDVARLAGGVAARNQKDVSLAASPEYFNAETRVFLFVNQIVGAGCSHRMAIEAILPFRRIFHCIKDRFVVIRPRHGACLLDVV